MNAQGIVNHLLGQVDLALQLVGESSVHLPRRGTRFVACYRGPSGQLWKSTGVTDREKAQAIADEFEAAARAQALQGPAAPEKGRSPHPGRPPKIAGPGGLTQREVALILGLSERAVRAIEKTALRKLAQHPLLRELWNEYLSGDLTEDAEYLSGSEIDALLGLTRNPDERESILKVIDFVQGHSTTEMGYGD